MKQFFSDMWLREKSQTWRHWTQGLHEDPGIEEFRTRLADIMSSEKGTNVFVITRELPITKTKGIK